MFVDCINIKQVWTIINKFGRRQWGMHYTDFALADILHLTDEYSPPSLLKIACLWSIWTHWCKYFYEHQLQDEVFVFNIVSEALHQLILRANETGPVTQWLNNIKLLPSTCVRRSLSPPGSITLA